MTGTEAAVTAVVVAVEVATTTAIEAAEIEAGVGIGTAVNGMSGVGVVRGPVAMIATEAVVVVGKQQKVLEKVRQQHAQRQSQVGGTLGRCGTRNGAGLMRELLQGPRSALLHQLGEFNWYCFDGACDLVGAV
eukprot:INCI12737.1.p2 GENE.INCI12737.1~~INCI12737.1.p2  ORF type:complete len:133 (+),score=16.54 INCI12737.1:192-590(+)